MERNRFLQIKKGVIGPIISVFVLVLIVSILSGLTFLFVSSLKTTALDQSDKTSATVNNEVISAANLDSGISVAGTSSLGAASFTLTGLMNATSHGTIGIDNASLSTTGVISNVSILTGYPDGWEINYTYSYVGADNANAYTSINGTESAGFTLVGYLPLIFLAIIFGAILTLVLRIILPYLNLGKDLGGF